MRKLTKSHLKVISLILSLILIAETAAFISIINIDVSYAKNLDLGNKYLLEMDYENAVAAFSEAIGIDAMSADAYIGRGDAYIALGNYANAWADYEKAEELSGRNDILSGKFPAQSIHVTSRNGDPLSDAEISLESDTHVYSLRTDPSGNASDVIFPDTYNMTVRRTDYQEAAQTVDFSYGTSPETAVTISMEPVVPEITPEDIQLIPLYENTRSTVSVDGVNTDEITIRTYPTGDYSIAADMNVNGISMTYEIPLKPAIFEKAYATDLNVYDDYRNIILVASGEDADTQTCVFCYNNESLQPGWTDRGVFDNNYNPGDGSFYTCIITGYGTRGTGPIIYHKGFFIESLTLTDAGSSAGYFTGNNYSGYVDGYPLSLYSSLPFYNDADCVQLSGSIPAGTPATITDAHELYTENGYYAGMTFYVESSAGNGWTSHEALNSSTGYFYLAG